MIQRAIATASATVANLGPGFDVLGLCLEGPRDTVTAELTDTGAIEIVEITGHGASGAGRLPTDPAANCAGVAARHVLERFGPPGIGARLWLDKGLPLGSGLGSSSASSVAGALAVANLIDPGLPREVLLDACREGERVAAGSPHADNVGPCLLGGVVACLHDDGETVHVLPLAFPDGLVLAVAKPDFDVRTADARAALPATVPLADAVRNVGWTAGLVTALAQGDMDLLALCLRDRLATPYRKALVPGFDEVVAAAVAAGAVGAGLAGSGPTIFALTDDRDAALAAADAMVEAFAKAGSRALAFVSPVDRYGAQVSRTSG